MSNVTSVITDAKISNAQENKKTKRKKTNKDLKNVKTKKKN